MKDHSQFIELKRLNSMSLIQRLVDLDELGLILGYNDQRSVKSWCKQNEIPILQMGKRTYTLTDFLDQHLERLLPELTMDNEQVSKGKTKETMNKMNNMSDAARKFLDNND